MEFWHMQLHPDDKDSWTPDYITEILKKTSYIGMGEWDDQNNQLEKFKHVLQIGDVVAVKHGKTPVALVEVVGSHEKENKPNKELDWFEHRRKIKIIDCQNSYDFTIPQPRGTFSACVNPNAKTSLIIKRWHARAIKEINSNKLLNTLCETLENSKNMVLTGAPGTGKTYLACEMASQIVGQEMDNSDQIELIQFHPSFDYTDLFEGLRPVKKENQELGFELRNGIFKDFCIKAVRNISKKYVFIIDEINRAEISKVFGELFFSIDPGYRGKRGATKTQYANMADQSENDFGSAGEFYVPENIYIIGTMNDIDRSVESFDFAMRRRFAWREIRPEDRLNMLEYHDRFDKKWIKDSEDRLIALNSAITDQDSLGSEYQIGPAYFLKLSYYDGDFSKLWEYHLAGLLKEYLRGVPDESKIIESLRMAYNNPEGQPDEVDGK